MTRKVKIIDADSGEQLREDYIPMNKGIFGFSMQDLVKIGGAVIAIVVFFVNGQNDKTLMQQTLSSQQATLSRLTDFKENSDSWNTYVYGTRFLDGQPMDKGYKVNNHGNVTQ